MNNKGQVGTDELLVGTPTLVEGIDNAVSVTVGFLHTCVLLADGSAWCWGDNAFGQLGNADDIRSGYALQNETRPRPVAIYEPIKELSAGIYHTCAVTVSGRVLCWGRNSDGTGTRHCTLGREEFGAVSQVPLELDTGGIRFVSVVAGGGLSVGLSADGQAYAWGSNFYGAIEPNGGAEYYCLLNNYGQLSTGQPLGAPIVDLDAKFRMACARTESGAIACWGDRRDGLLQDEVPVSEPGATPVFVTQTEGATKLATSVHSCLIRDGDGVYCWGYDTGGRITGGSPNVIEPTRVAGLK